MLESWFGNRTASDGANSVVLADCDRKGNAEE